MKLDKMCTLGLLANVSSWDCMLGIPWHNKGRLTDILHNIVEGNPLDWCPMEILLLVDLLQK